MNARDVACIVLASGQSERFGSADKLSADLGGQSVLERVLSTVRSVGFGEIYVVSQRCYDAGLNWVENKNPAGGQGHSLRLGLQAAQADGWESVLVALGDMPLVSRVNFVNVLCKSNKKQQVISLYESNRMPPALFRTHAMETILSQIMTQGARGIFDQLDLQTVILDADAAQDVDTPADLIRVREILNQREM